MAHPSSPAAGLCSFLALALGTSLSHAASPTSLRAWGTQGAGRGEFFAPAGVALDSARDVLVCDSRNHRIQQFTSDGMFLAQWG